VQNQAVKEAKGEILLFSDATTEYDRELLKNIVRYFSDSRVGGVGGELIYVNTKGTPTRAGGRLYWRYEKFLKKKESSITSLIGVSGCCYALRKELYQTIDPELISDFVIAQKIYSRGKRVVYEPNSVSYEKTCDTSEEEFNMRVRVAVRTLNGLWNMKKLLNPFKYGFFSLQLFFHKILRYMVPVFLILLFILNLILVLYTDVGHLEIMFKVQLVFYIFVSIGYITRTKFKLFSIPYYFIMTNLALLTGMLKFLKGEKKVIWKPLRTDE
jgi:cellulose synthase/poly-beta-1,6-N-acetylglucosamine synthase-like glycosyltransferase